MFSCIVGHNLMTEQQQQMWKINKLVCILWFQYVKSGHSEKKNHFHICFENCTVFLGPGIYLNEVDLLKLSSWF